MNTNDLRKLALEAKARADKATEGPWENDGYRFYAPDGTVILDYKQNERLNVHNDMKYLFHAHTDVPALADAVLALIEEMEALKEELVLVHKGLHAEHKRMREFLEKTQ